MKSILKMFLINSILLLTLIYAINFHQYEWFIKAVFYFVTILGIISRLSIIGYKDVSKKYVEICKDHNITFKIIDRLSDIIFLILFAYLDYKAIFILYFISETLSFVINQKLKEEEEKPNEHNNKI